MRRCAVLFAHSDFLKLNREEEQLQPRFAGLQNSVVQDGPAIFISYRRRDAGGHARALYDYLSRRFGHDRVFFDRSTIESGDAFPDTLRRGVERCAALVALIGPEWLEIAGDDGNRRFENADDFVRQEIALALETGKKVIPLLVDDTPAPSRDRLPDPLKELASRDALPLHGKAYEYEAQRRELVRLLAKVPGVPQPLPEVEPDSNRVRMLAEVRRIWIDGYLKESLQNLVRIELGLEETPGAVSRPWDLIVQPPYQAPRPLPPGQAMGTVFDELGQALLILGAPGAGKTTLLLELTRDLLDRAAQDGTHPIPVVFHLSSWAARQRPLVDWLADELTGRYYVPRKLAQEWANTEKVLPLLDGLDEVALEHREACVEAINAFRREHPLVAFAVCSRAAEYEELRERLELSGAVFIRPLSREQIGAYLKEAGKPLAGVRTVLRDDETLWELLETPLMLSIVALTYQGWSASEVRTTGSLEQRRTHLFANYTERMFDRRTKVTGYSREQITCWLNWLARSMINNNLSVFHLEWMQPDWLPSRAQRWIVTRAPLMFVGLVFGLFLGPEGGVVRQILGLEPGLIGVSVSGLVAGLAFGLVAGLGGWLIFGLAFGLSTVLIVRLSGGIESALIAGVFFGLVAGLVGEFLGKLDRITLIEALRWSWRAAGRSCALGLTFGLFFGLAYELVVRLFFGLGGEQAVALIRRLASYMVVAVLVVGLFVGLGGGLVGQFLDKLDRIAALRWSWRAAGRSCAFGLAFGLGYGLGGALKGGLASEKVIIGLTFGPMFGLAFGLIGGLVGEFLGKLDRIAGLRWSWRAARRIWAVGLVIGLVIGLAGGPAFRLISELAFRVILLGLVEGLAFGLIVGLLLGLVGGLTTTQIITRTIPNEGIRRSFKNASINILVAGLAVALVNAVMGGSGGSLVSLGLLGGLVGGLKNGGAACLQHYVLRILLKRNNFAPWNYIRFLDYATERVFLRKVGGGYIFTHRLLMQHFATLQPPDQARQIKGRVAGLAPLC